MNKMKNICLNIRKMLPRILVSIRSYFIFLMYYFTAVLKIRRIKANKNKNINIVLQVESFDKGGLEEVVCTIVNNLKTHGIFNLFIFVNANKLGYLGNKMLAEGAEIILLHKSERILSMFVKKIPISLVNMHYTVFGANVYLSYNIPIVYTIHNMYIWADDRFIESRKNIYNKVTKFIAVSEKVRDFFSKKFDINKDKIVTICNGLDIKELQQITEEKREDYGYSEKDFIFINVSSFNWHKFHILMLRAVEKLHAKYPNFKLLFIGNIHGEDCIAYLKRIVEDSSMSNYVNFLNYMPKNRVLGMLKMSNCAIFPSLIEGFSISIAEAAYCQLPMILSDTGGARDLIKANDIGIIIDNPYRDITEMKPEIFYKMYCSDKNLTNMDNLCATMEDIYHNSTDWKNKAKQGKNKIIQNFNIDNMCKQYFQEFNNILEIQ
jgi:glycosyltransferase involved in cell wall biosynthesis